MLRVLVFLLLLGSPALWAQELCDRQAGQLLDLLGIHDRSHVILQENLATYLFNLREPAPESALVSVDAFQAWLQQKEGEYRRRRTFGSNETGRWPAKFISSLARPYSDAQAGHHFEQIVSSFRHQCQLLKQAHPDYPRHYFAFGGLVHGRIGVDTDFDFFFNDPRGVKASRQFIVRGLSRGFAFDEAGFALRKNKYLAGEKMVMMGGPVYDLGEVEPWKKMRSMVMTRVAERGLEVHPKATGWTVLRRSYPPRHYEDPATDEERNRPI